MLGFAFGVRYGAPFGHRGFTHSALFAAGLAALLVPFLPVPPAQRPAAFFFLFLSTLSHPLLDALTDGGLGVALLWPFEERRYFFPWRPLAVPSIGVQAFFTGRAWPVLKSELLWVWAPGAIVYVLGKLARLLLR